MTFHNFKVSFARKNLKKTPLPKIKSDWAKLFTCWRSAASMWEWEMGGWEMQQKPGFTTPSKLPRTIHQNFPRESSTTFEAFFPPRSHKNLPQECRNFLCPTSPFIHLTIKYRRQTSNIVVYVGNHMHPYPRHKLIAAVSNIIKAMIIKGFAEKFLSILAHFFNWPIKLLTCTER